MKTRNQSKRLQSTGDQEGVKDLHAPDSVDDNETLSNISRDAVGRLLKRVKRGFSKEDVGYLRHCESRAKLEQRSKDNAENPADTIGGAVTAETDSSGGSRQYVSTEVNAEAGFSQHSPENHDEDEDSYWEEGFIPASSSNKDYQEGVINGVSVDFDVSPGLAKRKIVRRATAEEKEVAELVHKAHLLCLLGRGRLIDNACDDPLIQASLLSLLPPHLQKISDFPKLTAHHLSSLVNWFGNNFHVRSSDMADKSCHFTLSSALETREGTPDVVAALSVALFRALNLTTRFVSILDVVSLKPEAEKSESSAEVANKGKRDVFNSSTLMVARPSCSSFNLKSPSKIDCSSSKTFSSGFDEPKPHRSRKHDSHTNDKPRDTMSGASGSESVNEPGSDKSDGLKRKGDLEYEMQLEMALSATAIESSKISVKPSLAESPSNSTFLVPPSKKMKKIIMEEQQTSSNGVSVAIGSRKIGAPLYWAEVFCNGENLTGKWVHVDAVNQIIDGEDKVEAAAAACKKCLRYVVAFAGNGAKDVTRRYCTKWYKIASQRIDSNWWDAVLAPLKELECGATGGSLDLAGNSKQGCHRDGNRSSLEDMELETRALTEPLPTNQQAYRNHHLYVMERWLKKYEVLYPKGLVLGFCSGHAVYPRSCVKILHTKERWLREGLQVKADELPFKVLKRSSKQGKEEAAEDDEYTSENYSGSVVLYGRWQTEPLCLPHAVNGIVPKNERGQVDVWSEKCLPPGTDHLPLPRVALVAKRLEIDYAPAMVGFEFRNGRSYPLFNGIVVCSEFKDAIVEAYAEEEERRVAEEKGKNEVQALRRWHQLLSSIITRQRLNNCYGEGTSSQISNDIPKPNNSSSKPDVRVEKIEVSSGHCQVKTPEKQSAISRFVPNQNHEHEFVLEEQASGEEGSTRVKRCSCGFSVQFEEL